VIDADGGKRREDVTKSMDELARLGEALKRVWRGDDEIANQNAHISIIASRFEDEAREIERIIANARELLITDLYRNTTQR
jgi:hypothetical protein